MRYLLCGPSSHNLILICSKILFLQRIREQDVKGRALDWWSGDCDLILSVKWEFHSDNGVLRSLPALRAYESIFARNMLSASKHTFSKFKCTKSVHISSCSLSPHKNFLKMNTLGVSAHWFSLVSGFSCVTPEASLCKNLLSGHWWLIASSSLLSRVDSVSLLAIFRPPPKTWGTFKLGLQS